MIIVFMRVLKWSKLLIRFMCEMDDDYKRFIGNIWKESITNLLTSIEIINITLICTISTNYSFF